MRFSAYLAICTAALASPAAANDDQFNLSFGEFATIDLDKDTYLRLETQQRTTNDTGRMGQFLVRGLAAFKLSDKADIGAGYAYFLTDPQNAPRTNEHRFYQEFNLQVLKTDGGITLHSRTRLEQRVFEEDIETQWRFRNFFVLGIPVNDTNKIVLITEPFITLSNTAEERSGISLWQNQAGFTIPIADNVELVPSYLNQRVFLAGQDRTNHVAIMEVFTKF